MKCEASKLSISIVAVVAVLMLIIITGLYVNKNTKRPWRNGNANHFPRSNSSFPGLDFTVFDRIPYVDEHGKVIEHLKLEREEQIQVRNWLPSNATVLELGARYGTVSCNISQILDDSSRHVAVEPDKAVLKALETNRTAHGANFYIFDGVVSLADTVFNANGYGGSTENKKLGDKSDPLNKITILELQEKYGFVFDTLVADCEGALLNFLKDFAQEVRHFRLLIFEKDQPYRCNYDAVQALLISWGFKCVEKILNVVWREVWIRY